MKEELKNVIQSVLNIQKTDKYSRRAMSLVEAGENLFITGKAGTGKTTLLKKIIAKNKGKKCIAVLAPTGVAADNAGGFTMHSFLRMPTVPFIPHHNMSSLYSLDVNGEEVVKNLDMIIIDEVSMVRCDMLDAADMILRHYRKSRKPFGGVQIVMFGDLYQLMPVADEDDMSVLKEYYHIESPYFFCSEVLQKMDYHIVALEKVYRQEDPLFVNLLNNIRVGKVTAEDMDLLKTRYTPDYKPGVYEDITTLKTHNRDAKNYNEEYINDLVAKEKRYWAYEDNWWPEREPTNKCLDLKIGARVMFIKNDNDGHRYVNGTMGRVTSLGDDYVQVEVDKDGKKSLIYVERQTWERLSYTIDKKTKTIETHVIGTYKQIPLKLAWAVTVHKSQGLTFDEVVIDVAKAFTYGQVYVALSRCRSLEGLYLTSMIPSQKIKVDPLVQAYMDSIDEDGKAGPLPTIQEEVEPYEKNPLVIWVSARTLRGIREGRRLNYHKAIDCRSLAFDIFKSKDGELLVNDTYRRVRNKWAYDDMNNGNCPFIVRKYKSATFKSEWGGSDITVEILGDIEIRQGESADGYPAWRYDFHFGKILAM